MRHEYIFLPILVLSFAFATNSLSAVYYVDVSYGNDTNSGTSTNSPWKTLNKVNRTNLQPGDQVLFRRGQIWRETLAIPSSGTQSAYVVFDAYGTGDNPIISGANRLTKWTSSNGSYAKNGVTQPAFVYFGNTRLKFHSGARNGVALNEWDWNYNNGSNTLWVNVGTSPDNGNLELNSRNLCIYASGKNFIQIQNLTLEKARQQLIQASNGTNWAIKNLIARNGLDPASTGARGLFFLNNKFTSIDNSEVYGTYGDSGISFNTCDDSSVTNSKVHDHQGDGIYVATSARMTVADNTLYGQMGTTADNIQFNQCTDYKILRNDASLKGSNTQKGNIIVTQGSGGLIQSNKGAYGSYGVSCADSNSVVEFNLVHDHTNYTWNSGLYLSQGFANDNITWRYNISYADYNGMIAGSLGNDAHTNIKIYNNTIFDPKRTGVDLVNISGEFKNNILWCPNAPKVYVIESVAMNGTWTSNNNDLGPEKSSFVSMEGSAYSTLSSYASKEFLDSRSISKDPQFVDPANRNFNLKATSPCIDKGENIGLTKDFQGTRVYQGSGVDMGALEYIPLL